MIADAIGYMQQPLTEQQVLDAQPVCRAKTALPSETAATRLVSGDASAIVPVVVWTAARGMLVGSGAYAAGLRGPTLARAAIGGTLAIEAFVLAWAALNRCPSR